MIWFTRSRRKINGTFTPLLRWFRSIGTSAGHAWRRSLQLRVVVSTLTLSLVVIVILGAVLTGQITDRLLEAKISAATEELERSRTTVEGALAGAEDSDGLNARLERARAQLSNRDSDAGQTAGSAGTFEPVLIVEGDSVRADSSVGPAAQIPQSLRNFVQSNLISWQYATVFDSEQGGYSGPAIIFGTPTASDIAVPCVSARQRRANSLARPRDSVHRCSGSSRLACRHFDARGEAGRASDPLGLAYRRPICGRTAEGTHAGAR